MSLSSGAYEDSAYSRAAQLDLMSPPARRRSGHFAFPETAVRTSRIPAAAGKILPSETLNFRTTAKVRWRHVNMMTLRTKADFALQVKELVDVHTRGP